MPLKSAVGGLLLSFLAAVSACFTVVAPTTVMVINQDTTRLEGWFSTRGEWTLFPTSDFENYNPYVKDEDAKCVSMVNLTGSARSKYQPLHGMRVVVTGRAIKYDDLPSGNTAADRLLSKKFFANEPVENFCLRNFVFAVNSVRKK